MFYDDIFNILAFLPVLWVISIIATPVVAVVAKNRNGVGWFFLGVILGPFALLIVSLLPKLQAGTRMEISHKEYRSMSIEEMEEEAISLKILASRFNDRVSLLEEALKNIKPAKETPRKEPSEAPKPMPFIEAQFKMEEKEEKMALKEKGTGLEQRMGRYWLNRIGILVLATGIGFLITYTFKYFGPFIRILTGYLIGAALFMIGSRLEKNNKFVYYGRSLLGGGWAIAYFTTYAMHHFGASRLIHNQIVDLILLVAVALGILVYTLRYRSPELSSIALFVGYFTATLGDINYFTLATCLILAATSIVLVYKMRWLKMIFVGIGLTYATHIFWVFKQLRLSVVPVGAMDVQQAQFWLNSGFLVLYWLLFTVSIYLIRDQNEAEKKQLAVANFSNFLPFFVLAYSRIYYLYPQFKFHFVLGLGAIYALLSLGSLKLKNRWITITNTLIALSLLTFSVPLKALPLNTTFIWLFELPCLFYIGLAFQRRSFRVFSLALALILFIKVLSLDFYSYKTLLIFGHKFLWREFVYFVAAVSSYICVLFSKRIRNTVPFDGEAVITNLYSILGTLYLTTFVWDITPDKWLSLALALEALTLFAVGLMASDRYFRGYSFIILIVMSLHILFWDIWHRFDWQRWVTLTTEVLTLYFIYFLYRVKNFKTTIGNSEKAFSPVLATVANLILVVTLAEKVLGRWLSFAWTFEALAIFMLGILVNRRLFRWQAALLFVIVAGRIFFMDMNYDFDLERWARFAVSLAVYYGIYFLYKRLKSKGVADAAERSLPYIFFLIATFLLTIAVLKEAPRHFVSLGWGIEGALLFAVGFMAKDRIFRLGGFAIFGLTLLRIVVIDMAHIAVVYRIISFIVLGTIFLLTSFFYNKYNIDKKDE